MNTEENKSNYMNKEYNKSDYDALAEAINKITTEYNEMHDNLNTQQTEIERMRDEHTFVGDAADKFTSTFYDIKKQIEDRREYLKEINENGLENWIRTMSQTESTLTSQSDKLAG